MALRSSAEEGSHVRVGLCRFAAGSESHRAEVTPGFILQSQRLEAKGLNREGVDPTDARTRSTTFLKSSTRVTAFTEALSDAEAGFPSLMKAQLRMDGVSHC